MDRRQHLQSSRLSDFSALGEADQNRLYANAAHAGRQLPLQLRPAERVIAAEPAAAARNCRDGCFDATAQRCRVANPSRAHAANTARRPRGVLRAALHTDARFRSRRADCWQRAATDARAAPPRRRWLLYAIT